MRKGESGIYQTPRAMTNEEIIDTVIKAAIVPGYEGDIVSQDIIKIGMKEALDQKDAEKKELIESIPLDCPEGGDPYSIDGFVEDIEEWKEQQLNKLK